MEKKITSIGGQAIIEGVMMRGPDKIAMAVRKPNGEIVIENRDYKNRKVISKIPIIRGVFAFFDSLIIGVQSLMFSAQFYDIEDNKNKKKEEKPISAGLMYFSVFLSVIISIGMFILLPNFISSLIVPNRTENVILYNVIESILRILIFMIYLIAVSRMKDIQRVFEYHGAEHKSIFCYENGEELSIENVKKFSRFHPRCGTSFLLFVMLVSIIIFSLVGRHPNIFINMGIRILLLPIVAGVSYEIIRFAGKSKNKFVMLLNKPGMWLQRLTTREPDDSQIEVAIRSLISVIPEDKDDDVL
jgi:uncharacterized protein YqhQ